MSMPARKINHVNMLADALAYARRGWRVLPLHTPDARGHCSCRKATCQSIGKHPRTKSGLMDATTDEAVITKWWGQWSDANIGIATGAGSFVTLDVDPQHGGDGSLAALLAQHGALPDTLTARTGNGGRHINFEHPGVKVKNVQASRKLGDGLDVRGDGGYVVAPPSLHASGSRYAWLNERASLVQMPAWLRAVLTVESHARKMKADDGGKGNKLVAVIAERERNNTLTSYAGKMRRNGMTEEEIFAALAEMNKQRCRPPLPETEVRTISRSVARYKPAPEREHRDEGKGVPDKEAALMYLRSTLDLSIAEVVKRGDNGGAYEFALEGGTTIIVGDIDCLTSPRRARNAIADSPARVLLPKFKGDEWDEVVRAVLEAKVDVKTITAEEETCEWLSAIRQTMMDDVDLNNHELAYQIIERAKRDCGFVDTDGCWYLRLEALMRVTLLQFSARVTHKELALRLTRLKFVNREKGARNEEGQLVKARFWISPPKFDPD
jgi:hypothetical protein